MAKVVLLACLIAAAVARPQTLQLLQTPGLSGQQFFSLVPVNGVNGLAAQQQNRQQQVFLLPSGAAGGVSPFGSGSFVLVPASAGAVPASSGSAVAVQVPPVSISSGPAVAAQMPSIPSQAPLVIKQEPVTAAPTPVPAATPAPVVVVPAAKPATVAVVEKAEPAKYTYSYEVNDPSTGDAKSASESRDGNKVTGFYTVVDPDGVNRKVQYVADENGFVAQVLVLSRGAPIVTATHPEGKPQAVAGTAGKSGVEAKASAKFTSPAVAYQWGN